MISSVPPQASHDEVPEYWITYSDLLVSLLMVFALLLFLALASMQAEVAKARQVSSALSSAIAAAENLLGAEGTAIILDKENGTLSMNSEVLFDYGSAVVKPEGRAAVRGLATKFIPAILANPAVDSMLHEIVIEGHTDTIGSYMSNLRLSQARAYAVMEQMIDATAYHAKGRRFQQVVVASGKSEVDPVFTNGHVDGAKSRRIEVHFRTRNDALLKRIYDEIGSTK